MAPGKPKIIGVFGLISALIALILTPQFDNDPATVPQWAEFFALAWPNIALWFARDNAKSSETVGAK